MTDRASKSLLIHDILGRYWGYDAFRPAQEEIILSVLDGNDTLGLLPTGGGKSLTFQIPALASDGLTIVVTPLISLMKDQVDNLLARGIRAVCLHSGLSRAEHRLGIDRCRLGKARLLYLSPEKLQSERFLETLRGLDIRLIVVDEAHCISQWGYDFRPAYLKIASLRALFPHAPLLALTASATPEVVADIMARLEFRRPNVFSRSFSRPNISYIVRNDYDKDRQLLNILTRTSGSAIVYVRSRIRTRQIAEMLSKNGIAADYYHAGLQAQEKSIRQEEWKSEKTRVIVATNAFGMGIDKPDVRTVVHIDCPLSLEEYYQEAGRAGRDGKPAFAVLIVSPHDKGRLTRAIDEAFPPKDYIRRVYELAGNFLSIPVGEGFGRIYEFNFAKFTTIYSLNPRQARSALHILTQCGHIEFMDEVSTHSRVMITATKEELYHITLDNTKEKVFNVLMRSYTGLFADFIPIDESMIASRAETTEQQVCETLVVLSRMHILQYIPRKTTPYILYTSSRQLPPHILIPPAIYEEQRRRMEMRLEAMKEFAFGSVECRVNVMLRYFGEKPRDVCGTCDECRRRKKRDLSPDRRHELGESLRYMIGQQPRPLRYLLDESAFRQEEIIDALREMMRKGIVTMTENEYFTLNKH
ncbi:ATP-dependent DNA helicase RecQ [uncultured Muribaculum sp.]|uniref:RecQ family ATP-dependent DNA helicase n=1 Tax=uncultured Muribaculum sp. TaxID=1918613 RepID=UPI0025E1645A|nr:ATP-dependent DNA helicase RecQ [uncultured Muribaculum sp.]